MSTSVNNNTNIQACSGGIYKSCEKSWFRRFRLESPLAEELLAIEPTHRVTEHSRIPVVVLQMIICGDMEVIAEVVKKEDYECKI